MTYPTQHSVVWPDGQGVFSFLLQSGRVMLQAFLAFLRRNTKMTGQRRVELPFSFADVFSADIGIWRRVLVLLVHQENGMENLHSLMRIHRGRDLGDGLQVTVDEFAQSAVVIHCALPTATSYIQFKTGNTERVLHIHQ